MRFVASQLPVAQKSSKIVATTRSQSRAMATIPTVANLQALILQLQNQVTALENAAATTAPAAPAATTAATTAVVFADTPQTLGAKDLIDYLSKRGSDIYKQGIAPLDDKALTEGFNMTANQTVVFTEAAQSHHCDGLEQGL